MLFPGFFRSGRTWLSNHLTRVEDLRYAIGRGTLPPVAPSSCPLLAPLPLPYLSSSCLSMILLHPPQAPSCILFHGGGTSRWGPAPTTGASNKHHDGWADTVSPRAPQWVAGGCDLTEALPPAFLPRRDTTDAHATMSEASPPLEKQDMRTLVGSAVLDERQDHGADEQGAAPHDVEKVLAKTLLEAEYILVFRTRRICFWCMRRRLPMSLPSPILSGMLECGHATANGIAEHAYTLRSKDAHRPAPEREKHIHRPHTLRR